MSKHSITMTPSRTSVVRPPSIRSHVLSLGLAVSGLLVAPSQAFALQPLSEFVRAARTRNFDTREQAALVAQRDDEARQASWKLAPVVTASGSYTNNQYAAIATIPIGATGQTTSVTIMAQNQLDATFSATLPVVDIGAWERIGAARSITTAARAQANATVLDVQRAVAQAYFQVVAEDAVLRSSNERRDTAQANLDFVRTRNSAGVAPELDLKRAASEFESARQDVTEAEYQLRIARRSLATVAGLDPSPGGFELSDDTSPEPPLDSFTVGSSSRPSVLAASETARAACVFSI